MRVWKHPLRGRMLVAGAEMGRRLLGGGAARAQENKRRFGLFGGIEAEHSQILAAYIRAARRDDLVIEIDSHGGSLEGARRIYDALLEHEAHVDVEIVGRAWSAAALIAMSGKRRRIAFDATMFFHRPSHAAGSPARPNRLAAWSVILSSLMASRAGISPDLVDILMEDETELSAAEAISWGFCHSFLVPARGRR